MDSWKGSTEHQVIMQFGAPTQTTSDGAGGKVLNYTDHQSTSVLNPYNPYRTSVNTYDNSWYKEFYINSEGKVYSWRTNYPNPRELNKEKTTVAVVAYVIGFIVFIAILASSGG